MPVLTCSTLPPQYNINYIGVILTINSFLPLLERGTQKKVITINTGGADLEFIDKAQLVFGMNYAATKAALLVAIKKYAIAYGPQGFNFLSISPGMVATGGMSHISTLSALPKG